MGCLHEVDQPQRHSVSLRLKVEVLLQLHPVHIKSWTMACTCAPLHMPCGSCHLYLLTADALQPNSRLMKKLRSFRLLARGGPLHEHQPLPHGALSVYQRDVQQQLEGLDFLVQYWVSATAVLQACKS